MKFHKSILFISFLVSIFLVTFSCEKSYSESYYDSGELMKRVYSQNRKYDSIIHFNKNGNIETIQALIKKDSFYVINFNKEGNIENEGIIYKDKHFGKWKFHKNGFVNVVREYLRIDDRQYLNQEWHYNREGDTLRNEGHFLKIRHENKFKAGQVNVVSFILETPLLDESEIFTDIEYEYYNKVSNQTHKENIILSASENNECIYKINVGYPGFFHFKGFFLEIEKDDENTILRKTFFDKKIEVVK